MNEPTKLPPLRPVMTEREKVLEKALNAIISCCVASIQNAPRGWVSDFQSIKQQAEKALNFKYGGGE